MNTNPNAKRILCFGDSNTWGYIPGTKHNRYEANIRWTGVLQDTLGSGFEIIEEGLNSRGIIKGDSRPGKEQRSAMDYILACLDTHDPLHYVVICLGANELKAEFELSAGEVGENMKKLVSIIQSRPSQFCDTKPEIIIIVPAMIDESADRNNKFVGAHQKSVELREVLLSVGKENNCHVVDIQAELETGIDGVHLLEGSHKLLGETVAVFLE